MSVEIMDLRTLLQVVDDIMVIMIAPVYRILQRRDKVIRGRARVVSLGQRSLVAVVVEEETRRQTPTPILQSRLMPEGTRILILAD